MLRAVALLPGRFQLRPHPSTGDFHDDFVAHRSLRRARPPLRHLGHLFGDAGRSRQRQDAGDIRSGARGRAGLSAPAIHHDRHRRRRDLPHRRLSPRLARRRRLCGRRHPVRLRGFHRDERVRARQCAHRAGRHRLARRRARTGVPRRCHHRAPGGGARLARRHALFRLPHRHAAFCAERSGRRRFHGGARLRRLADLHLRAIGRRHLHQGRRCRRRSRRQGRSRHSGRRSTQSGHYRRQRWRQCRRLRRHGGRPVRDLCRYHCRDHGSRRHLLRFAQRTW